MIFAVVRHLVESTIFVLVVALFCRYLKRRGAASRHLLWLAASAKFLVPLALFSWLGSALGGILPLPQVSPGFGVVVSNWVAPPATAEALKLVPGGIGEILLVIWALGCIVTFGLWLPKLWLRLEDFRSAKELPPEEFLRLKQRIGLRRDVKFQLSSSVEEPSLAGFRTPTVLIPSGLPGKLSPAELESVILHELAHAKRRDNWTAAFAHAMTCLFWFYPVLWWIEKQLRRECEAACDETVVACGTEPDDYVAGILKVCRYRLNEGVAGICGACHPNLKNRMEVIMSLSPPASTPKTSKALLAAPVAIFFLAPFLGGFLTAPAFHGRPATSNRQQVVNHVRKSSFVHNNGQTGVNQVRRAIVVRVTGQGTLEVNQKPVSWNELGTEMHAVLQRRKPANRQVFIQVDANTKAVVLVRAMKILRGSGAQHIAVIGKVSQKKR